MFSFLKITACKITDINRIAYGIKIDLVHKNYENLSFKITYI